MKYINVILNLLVVNVMNLIQNPCLPAGRSFPASRRFRVPFAYVQGKQPGMTNAGFSLIELLIVVVIIGVLSSFLMVNFVGIRQRARDVERKANLRQIQSALELYRADLGAYPVTASFPACGSTLSGGSPPSTYMQIVPCDPLNSGQNIYTYDSNGTTYTLYTCLENLSDSEKDDQPNYSGNNSTYCDGTAGWSYTIKNP